MAAAPDRMRRLDAARSAPQRAARLAAAAAAWFRLYCMQALQLKVQLCAYEAMLFMLLARWLYLSARCQ